MDVRREVYLYTLYLFVGFARICNGQEEAPKLTLEDAVRIVEHEHDAWGDLDSSKPQTYYRILATLRSGYNYEEQHAETWLKVMRDSKRDRYGRLCAAYFLLDRSEEAREFVLKHLKAANLEGRYNAVEVVLCYVRWNSKKQWGVDLLIRLAADGSLDEHGGFQASSPLDDVCWCLGYLKEKKAVPTLIAVLERRPDAGGAAFALGEIGDQRAVPVLMKILQERTDCQHREVAALGKLKCREAVPILISRLGHPKTTFSGMDVMETRTILEALRDIGDKRAIEPIEQYLQGGHPKKSKTIAHRVLMQLNAQDPVQALFALLDDEPDALERGEILHSLAKHREPRVVEKFAEIARTSDSAYMRRQAIHGLQAIGDRASLLVLASLLDCTWPQDLKPEGGWKSKPDFAKEFPEEIQGCLRNCTKQDFGNDRAKWEAWIIQNVKAGNAERKQ